MKLKKTTGYTPQAAIDVQGNNGLFTLAGGAAFSGSSPQYVELGGGSVTFTVVVPSGGGRIQFFGWNFQNNIPIKIDGVSVGTLTYGSGGWYSPSDYYHLDAGTHTIQIGSTGWTGSLTRYQVSTSVGAFVDITKKSRLSGAFTGKPTKVRVGGVWKSDIIGLPLNTALPYAYTGAAQLITVPAGATAMTVDISGSQGGSGDSGPGGLGGRVQASIPVTPGEVLQLNIGQQGPGQSGAGSFGGGGGGGADSTPHAGSGGGATDIRRGAFALADRLVVAGGGGGNINNDTTSKGGLGGGLVGGDGSVNGVGTAAGKGGTQSAGGVGGTGGLYGAGTDGALGQGGIGRGGNRQGGGGGGGYYGGGGGTGDVYISDHPGGGNGGGGGGSSYAISTSIGVVHTQGSRAGNGVATVTFLASVVTRYEDDSSPSNINYLFGAWQSNGRFHYVKDGSAQVAFTFVVPVGKTGSVSLKAEHGPAYETDHTYNLDGGSVVQFSQYSATYDPNQTSFTVSGISPGTHTINVFKGSIQYLIIDAFELTVA